MDEIKLRLSLKIISGRKKYEDLDYNHFEILGWDSYKFGYSGKPSENEVKERAEDIVYDAIEACLTLRAPDAANAAAESA